LSYAPALGRVRLKDAPGSVKRVCKIRAADAKEVGVGNPAEETYCHPNAPLLLFWDSLSISYRAPSPAFGFASLVFTPAKLFVKCRARPFRPASRFISSTAGVVESLKRCRVAL